MARAGFWLVTSRTRFCQLAMSLLGKPSLWGAKGPNAYDCSGSVTASLLAAGGPDIRATHNAKKLHDESRLLVEAETPLPGDLVFYGLSTTLVEHVGVWMVGGKVLSADGATSHILSIEEALQNPHNRVCLHDHLDFRRDLPGNPLAIHRNTWLDALELVSR